SSVHAPASRANSPLSLHDALPICVDLRGPARVLPLEPVGADLAPSESIAEEGYERRQLWPSERRQAVRLALDLDRPLRQGRLPQDRKSTRLNSSHEWISYAVFCLK